MERRKWHADKESLANELAGVSGLDRNALAERWRDLFGTKPPARTWGGFLMRAVAYRMQEKMHGGLKPAEHRMLAHALNGASKISTPAITIKSGTRLLREWHGVTYEVIVAEGGVMFQGKRYRSLSEVARIITGVKWSGPLFFGLKKQAAS